MAGVPDSTVRQIEQMRGEILRLRAQQRWAALAALCVVLLCLTSPRGRTSQGTSAQSMLTAAGLTIVGPDGQPRMTLSSDKDGGTLTLRTSQGDKAAFLGVDADGGYLRVQDKDNNRATILAIGPNSGLLNVYNKDNKTAIFLGSTNNGAGTLEANGPDGKIRAALATDEDGGALVTRNNSSQVRAYFGESQGGDGGYAYLMGSDKKGIVLSGTSTKGGGLINIEMPDGSVAAILDAQPSHGGRLELRNGAGKVVGSCP